jgi:hypothetical protein
MPATLLEGAAEGTLGVVATISLPDQVRMGNLLSLHT